MRTLLRHTATHLYFQAPDAWTNNPELALDFRFMDRALNCVENWRLSGVELAFVFDDPQQVVPLPLEKAALQVAV
ncbi:MAG TPA: hypothetical protein VNT26_17890 [Candidatus Sulfotelmatobacter sp.]|nr:hypothetical protein [Candidatus Sulfotelmatobacter sp.]